ncbi:MAG: hypothetical protein C4523_13470 [Myxococcales bacterium]|nr:MAG: hypothetical protein C4523_13470 [Myxococcales bacterium]
MTDLALYGDFDFLIPTTDGDEEELDVEPALEEEPFPIEPSICGNDRHSNGETIQAAEGGPIRVCLGGDPLDGSVVLLPAGALSADARVTLSLTDDLVAEGWRPIGSAVLVRAIAVETGLEAELTQAAYFRLPAEISELGSDPDQVKVRVAFKPIDGDANSASLLDLSGPPGFDFERGLISFGYDRLGVLQAMTAVLEQ